jgi:hypothetical protein
MMQLNDTLSNINGIYTLRKLLFPAYGTIQRTEMMLLIREVSIASAVLQMLLLVLLMLTGTPGIYTADQGLMYVSDTLCNARVFAAFFMLATFPTWIVLACSISLEPNVWRRRCILIIISLPMPMGIGIVLFDWCSTPVIHYIYVSAFVVAISGIHIIVASTARHFRFLQSYFVLLVGTAMCGISFLTLSMFETGPGTQRNAAVILEYLAAIGFIALNSLSADRVYEHINL